MSQVVTADGRWPVLRRRRRSRLIDVLRIVLPAVVLLLIGLVVVWPQIMDSGNLTVPAFKLDTSGETDLLRMEGPRYLGQTERERPYEITAASASFDPLTPDRIHLDRPAADIALGDDSDVRLDARNGVYDRTTNRLALDGGIEVVTSAGYRFATPSARVDLERGRVVGSEAVAGRGPSGELSANRFEIRDGGDILRFEGRVKVTLIPSVGKDTSAAEPETAPAVRGRSS